MTAQQTVERGRWYPSPPPALAGEDDYAYTNRITGAAGAATYPYDHRRYRECSMGYHMTCSCRSHPDDCGCECPCHADGDTCDARAPRAASDLLADLYYLPRGTADRVMTLGTAACLTAAEKIIDPIEQVRVALSGAYGSDVSEWFAADVVNILRDKGQDKDSTGGNER